MADNTGKIYRWSGSTYIEISPSPGSTDAVPEGSTNLYFTTARAASAAPVQSVAGKTGAVTLTKADVGLGNVDNTSDANKPISTATQSALNGKQNSLGYTPVNKAGDTMTGALTASSFTANSSSANWGILFNTAGTGIGGIWNDGTSIALLNINGGWNRSSIILKPDGGVAFHGSLASFDFPVAITTVGSNMSFKITDTTNGGNLWLVGAGTNPNKPIRVSNTGDLEFLNSAYSSVVTSISDTGGVLARGGFSPRGDIGLDYQLSGNRLMIRSDGTAVSIDAVNPASSAFDVLRFRGTNMLFNAQSVWHAGNFNPDSKASLAGANYFTDQNPIIMSNGGNQVNQFNVGDRTGWYDVAGNKDIWFYTFATKWLTLNGNVTANGSLIANSLQITGLSDGFFQQRHGYPIQRAALPYAAPQRRQCLCERLGDEPSHLRPGW